MVNVEKQKALAPLVKNTPPFKIKPKAGKNFQAVDLKKQFGFLPDIIVIECLIGQKNLFVVRALLTPAEVKKHEDAQKAAKILKKPGFEIRELPKKGGDTNG